MSSPKRRKAARVLRRAAVRGQRTGPPVMQIPEAIRALSDPPPPRPLPNPGPPPTPNGTRHG